MNEEIRTLDLFSGIGGFSLGLERAGPFRTVAFCEQDAYAQRVLRKHWPDTPIYDDVTTLNPDRLGRIDLVTAGFPCQPASVAGARKGREDDRWLWPEIVRIVRGTRPSWLLLENVRGLLTLESGMVFEDCIADLEAAGYESQSFIIPACAVDAPHRRDRVWIIAHASSVRRYQGAIYEEVDFKEFEQWWSDDADIFSGIVPSAKGVRGYDGVSRKLDTRQRLQLLGNAVVPQVVEQIGRAILAGWKR